MKTASGTKQTHCLAIHSEIRGCRSFAALPAPLSPCCSPTTGEKGSPSPTLLPFIAPYKLPLLAAGSRAVGCDAASLPLHLLQTWPHALCRCLIDPTLESRV